MRRLICTVVVLALAFGSGCGFHLRGQTPLPAVMARPYIDPRTSTRRSMRRWTRSFARRARRLLRPPPDATGVIRLHVDKTDRELLSVTADNKPGEYEVYYAVGVFGFKRGQRVARAPEREAHA